MSNKSLEHLSSLMDGEVTRESGSFLARRLCADQELGEAWERYHLIRDCLRSSGKPWSVSAVRLQVETGNDVAEPLKKATQPGWLRPLSGLAIAASVAVIAVLSLAPRNGAESTPGGIEPFSSPNPLNAAPLSEPASFNGGANERQRLNNYLLRHNQVTGSVSRQGFVSLVPIVVTAKDPVTEDVAEADTAADTNAVDNGQQQP